MVRRHIRCPLIQINEYQGHAFFFLKKKSFLATSQEHKYHMTLVKLIENDSNKLIIHKLILNKSSYQTQPKCIHRSLLCKIPTVFRLA